MSPGALGPLGLPNGRYERVMCSLCSQQHTRRFLCDPAAAILAAAIARKEAHDMPTVDFDEPLDITNTGLGLGKNDQVMTQIVVNAAVIESGGVPFPALIITGKDLAGRALPRWVYTSTGADVLAVGELFRSRAKLAVSQVPGQHTG